MYGIQGYIARTVNHDQKVPKHWREIEDERGKKKCNAKEKPRYIITDRTRTIDNIGFYDHAYAMHEHTYTRARNIHMYKRYSCTRTHDEYAYT